MTSELIARRSLDPSSSLGTEYRQSDILTSVRSGELIRRVRQRRGLTQAQLAARAGTSQPVVSAYEHGRRDPTIGTLAKLVEAAGEELRLDAGQRIPELPPPRDVHEHNRRLLDVLSLADAIPTRRRARVLDAPRMTSG